jgi:hypothetical protein
MDGSEGLDRFTNTFTIDRSFCDALALAPAARHVAKLVVYARWAHKYINPIQEDLSEMAKQHFSPTLCEKASFWTIALVGGVLKDVCLVPYLTVHGLVLDAGFAVRRSLEHVGVLAHLWHRPENAACLDDPDAPAFRSAFVIEPDKQKAGELKQKRIQKRFAQCMLHTAASKLYSLFSSYTVHGGSPRQIMMNELEPTRFSCGLVNRPDPQKITGEVELLGNACEILCTEIVYIHGTFGKLYGVTPSPGGEGGFFLTHLLTDAETPDSLMSELTNETLENLGWTANKLTK